MQVEKFYYDNRIVKNFCLCNHTLGSGGWSVFGSLQLCFPSLNITQYGSFAIASIAYQCGVDLRLCGKRYFSWACITRAQRL